MNERNSLQKVFEGILSSQSFELLRDFSDDAMWASLQPEEKELLAQLFLLNAEKAPTSDMSEQQRHAKKSYRAACSLVPTSARVWYRLGAFLALSEDKHDLQEALQTLQKAVSIEPRFFDAQYALGSVCLRIAVLEDKEDLLYQADAAFLVASTLVDEKTLSADFSWHRAIVWSAIAKASGEPADMKKAIEFFSKAQADGCCRADFFNDYAHVVVELALAISDNTLIHQAISLYIEAIEAAQAFSKKEKAFCFFNVGCCYQHLFESTCEREYFLSADRAFEMATSFKKSLFDAWEQWGILLFRSWRIWREPSTLLQTVEILQSAERSNRLSAVGLATLSQALLWYGLEGGSDIDIDDAWVYAERAMNAQEQNGAHPEPFVALSLCYLERGKYFGDPFLLQKALDMVQEGLVFFPRSVILWHALALVKMVQADVLDDETCLQESAVGFSVASRSFYAFSPQFFADWGVVLLDLAERLEKSVFAEEAIAKFAWASERQRSVFTLYHMGRAYYVLGDLQDDEECFERAIHFFTEAFCEDDTFLPTIYHLALSYLHLGELTGDNNAFHMACRYYEELLMRDPEDEIAWADYALALIHLGENVRSGTSLPREWFQAEEALFNAEKLGFPSVHYHKACLFSIMGNFPEALEALQEAFSGGALPDPQEILDDEWLEPLAQTQAFQIFMKKITPTDL